MQTLTIFSLVLAQLTVSVLTDRIVVDDSAGNWTYSLGWRSATASAPCTTCTAQPDPARALGRTWHDTIGPGYADLSFTGISIELYTICPDRSSSYGTSFSFTLDNALDGAFIGPRPACAQYTYNYLVYARTNLSLAEHKLRVTNAAAAVDLTSNLLLDYAIYDDGTAAASPSSEAPRSSPAATTIVASPLAAESLSFPLVAIVAPAVAAGVMLLAMIFQILYHLRSRKRPISTSRGDDLRPYFPVRESESHPLTDGSFDHGSKHGQPGVVQPLLGCRCNFRF
jgi:hypothetical protein